MPLLCFLLGHKFTSWVPDEFDARYAVRFCRRCWVRQRKKVIGLVRK